MPDVSIKVMSMNPKREYSIEVKGLDQEQLPDYVSKTYRDLIDLLGAEQIDIKVDMVVKNNYWLRIYKDLQLMIRNCRYTGQGFDSPHLHHYGDEIGNRQV